MFASLPVVIFLAVQLPGRTTVSATTDWTDFAGGCLQPASLKRNEILVFTSPAKVLKAVERYQADRLGGSCGPEFADAFERLEWLLDKERVLSDICGQEAYERIRAFHSEFIHFYVPELTREQLWHLNGGGGGGWFRSKSAAFGHQLKPIPAALRQFFINFAKQANAQCKQQLVNRLDALASNKSLVNPEDFAVLGKYKSESDRLKFLYEFTKAGTSSYGRDNKNELTELEMIDMARTPSSSAGAQTASQPDGGGGDSEEGARLYLQVPFDDRLKRIKEACERRFMPIYLELFAPTIRLNNLGYIDRANSKAEDLALEAKSFAQWFVIIQACEVLKDIEILHDASAQSALMDMVLANSHLAERAKKAESGSMLGRDLKILSREQADQLKQAAHDQVRPLYDPKRAQVEHQRVAFADRLWLVTQSEMQKQVAEFESNVGRLIREKTSLIKAMQQDLSFQLGLAFRSGKRQALEKDETAMLGRLVAFLERHRNLLRGFSLVMSIVMISVMAG